MTIYVCQACGTDIEPDKLKTFRGIRCIMCGHRILTKKRPPIIKRLRTD